MLLPSFESCHIFCVFYTPVLQPPAARRGETSPVPGPRSQRPFRLSKPMDDGGPVGTGEDGLENRQLTRVVCDAYEPYEKH